MPVVALRFDGWQIAHDLSSALSARTFSATYGAVDAAQVWDPTIYETIELFDGADPDPDLVILEAEFDGDVRELITAVVDESGRAQTDEGYHGALAGRDRLAFALDRRPAEAFTIDGLDVVDNLPVARATYRSALADLATRAGLALLLDVGDDDYAVGRSIPVATRDTYGEAIAQLLEPWRFGERYAHDAWIEDTTLRVVRRDLGAAIDVHRARVLTSEFTRTRRVAAADVRVEGASYETLVADPSAFSEGCPGTRLSSSSFQSSDLDPLKAARESYSETITQHYDAQCRLFWQVRQRIYGDLVMSEHWTTLVYFVDNPGGADHGLKLYETEDHRISNDREGYDLFYERASYTTRVWSYFDDDGSTEFEDEVRQVFGEEVTGFGGKVTSLAESERHIKSYRYIRSGAQLMRQWNLTRIGPAGEQVSQEQGSEVSPYKIEARAGSVIPQGMKQETVQIVAGSEDALAQYASDLVGSQATVDLLRTRLIEEHGLVRIGVRLTMTPDHRVQPGKWVTVLEATDWDVSSFYVVAMRLSGTDEVKLQEVTGLAWVTP